MSLIHPDGSESSWSDLESGDNDLYAAADTFMGIFGFHRVRQIDTIHNKEGHMDPANANNLPEATDSDIHKEFDAQLEIHGRTTTLDVKNGLRARGFWVNQKDVSKAIYDIADSTSDYDYFNENGHRVYQPAALTTTSVNPLLPPWIGQPQRVKKATIRHSKPGKIGDWEVFSRDDPLLLLPAEIYTNMTRNKARYEYSKQYSVKYVNTVARKA